MWEPAAAELRRIMTMPPAMILPDLRGHGDSPVARTATMAEMADDLAALLDRRGVTGPVTLVGLSMGGYVAFEFVRRHRARVGALVLTCTRANADDDAGRARREAQAASALREGSRAVVDVYMPNLFGPKTKDELKVAWREIMSRTDPEGVAAALRGMAARSDQREALKAIDLPTLVVAGEHDLVTPVAALREIHDGIRGSRLEIMSDCGHLAPIEQPARFAELLAAFIAP